MPPHILRPGTRKDKQLFQIIKDIAGEFLHIVLIRIGTGVLVPFISGQTVGNATTVLSVGIELYKTGNAVVADVPPCGEDERAGCSLKVCYYVGIVAAAVEIGRAHV